jgi:hypothetical protein
VIKKDVTDCTSNLKVNSSVGLLVERGIDRSCLVIAFKIKCRVGFAFWKLFCGPHRISISIFKNWVVR